MANQAKKKNDVLKDELFAIFTGLKAGEVDREVASEMIKAANSICTVVKTEIAVAKYNNELGIKSRGRKKSITM